MKVKDLLELLETCDPEAEVSLMEQPHYPMEHSVGGIALREDCRSDAEPPRNQPGTAPSDVVLVEGAWLRYGTRAAWDAVRRRGR